MEKIVWVMLKQSDFQHEDTHQSEDQDHSTIQHGWGVAQTFATQACGNNLFGIRRVCVFNATVKFIVIIIFLDLLKLLATTTFTFVITFCNQNCGFSIHCSLLVIDFRQRITYCNQCFWCRHLHLHHMFLSWQLRDQSCPCPQCWSDRHNIGDHDSLQALWGTHTPLFDPLLSVTVEEVD